MPEEPKKLQSFKVETPIGTIESDSGNHTIDIISVVGVLGILYLGKTLIAAYYNKKI
tara:strand:- start:429 stop:599 length:171 start_codon:yes stop_codon:yes gene_type:complete